MHAFSYLSSRSRASRVRASVADPRPAHVRAVVGIVDFASRSPFVVLAIAVLVLGALAYEARGLDVRSDLTELLPKDSPGFKAYEHQAGRAGGAATLIVIVSSPDRAHNERFVDDLASRLEELAKRRPDL